MSSTEKLPRDDQARVGWAYEAAGDVERIESRFDAWAELYDDDVCTLLDWQGPVEAVEAAMRHVPQTARILDAGAGTGLVGKLLAEKGYGDIVAVDLSQNMLEIAEAKGVYRAVHKADLTKRQDFVSGSFDAVLSVGTSGYVSGPVITEFTRITAPGGHIIFTISDARYAEGGFDAEIAALARDGIVRIVESGSEFAAIPRADADHMARVHVLQKCAGGE